jgi:hypothetical protein
VLTVAPDGTPMGATERDLDVLTAALTLARLTPASQEECENIVKAVAAALNRGCSPWTVAEAIWIRFLRAKDRPAGTPTEPQRHGSLTDAGDVIAHYTAYERSQGTALIGLILAAGNGGVPFDAVKRALEAAMAEDLK